MRLSRLVWAVPSVVRPSSALAAASAALMRAPVLAGAASAPTAAVIWVLRSDGVGDKDPKLASWSSVVFRRSYADCMLASSSRTEVLTFCSCARRLDSTGTPMAFCDAPRAHTARSVQR